MLRRLRLHGSALSHLVDGMCNNLDLIRSLLDGGAQRIGTAISNGDAVRHVRNHLPQIAKHDLEGLMQLSNFVAGAVLGNRNAQVAGCDRIDSLG
ncbi:hypothetical protein D3C78_974540 [compost metagenome]